jgi:hypothetical protein
MAAPKADDVADDECGAVSPYVRRGAYMVVRGDQNAAHDEADHDAYDPNEGAHERQDGDQCKMPKDTSLAS